MTLPEQKELDQLRDQLSNAQAAIAELKARLGYAVEQLQDELRLYRGLFWGILAIALAATLFHLVQN